MQQRLSLRQLFSVDRVWEKFFARRSARPAAQEPRRRRSYRPTLERLENIELLNAAPVLDVIASPALAAINEDEVSSAGTTVGSIVIDGSITDADGAIEAIAVTAVDSANGLWEFSLDGSSWNTVTAAADNALLLDTDNLLRFVPNANWNGQATISFCAWDKSAGSVGGTADTTTNGGSTPFSEETDIATIEVNAVNDAPSFTASDPAAVDEDDGTITATNWASFNPGGGADEASQTATYTVSNVSNSSLFAELPAIDANGVLTYTLAADANGTSTFDVVVSDGTDDSAAQTFTIAVNAINDAPSFTASDPAAVDEDDGAITVTDWASFNPGGGADEASQTATFTVSNVSNSNLFAELPTIDANGVLTYTLAADANGTSTFDVVVSDGTDDSAAQTFTIAVNAANDAPIFTASDPAAVDEDDGAITVTDWATFNPGGGADEASQTATYTISNVSNSSLFAELPAIDADGVLTYTLAADANGTSTFDVVVNDGTDDSAAQTFTIAVNAVNDAPSFTASNPAAVDEDDGAITVTDWASFSPGGGGDEANQTAAYTVSNVSNADLFAELPAIDAGGVLTYTLAANANGAATVTVFVQDDGGTANSGDDTSASVTFTITVNAVNDAPSFTASAATFSMDEGAVNGSVIGAADATDIDLTTLEYTIVNDPTSGGFDIDSDGNLVVADNTLVDFEASNGSYALIVEVSDGNLSAQAVIAVQVGNAPPSTPIDIDDDSGGVFEGIANGNYIGITVHAQDPAGGAVSYEIVNDSSGGAFHVDPVSGVVTVASALFIDFESSGGTYSVTVRARDDSYRETITVFDVTVQPSPYLAYHQTVINANQLYQTTVLAAVVSLQSAINCLSANANLESQAAWASFESALGLAYSNYMSEEALAAAVYSADIDDDTTAWALYQSAEQAAWDDFLDAETFLWSAYLDAIGGLHDVAASAALTAQAQFISQAGPASSDWISSEATAWNDYLDFLANAPGSPAGIRFNDPPDVPVPQELLAVPTATADVQAAMQSFRSGAAGSAGAAFGVYESAIVTASTVYHDQPSALYLLAFQQAEATFSSALAAADTALLTARTSADQQLQSEVDDAVDDYEGELAAALEEYNNAIAPYLAAWDVANANYFSNPQDAGFQAALAAAEDNLASAKTSAAQIRTTRSNNAETDLNNREEAAHITWANSDSLAHDVFLQSTSAAEEAWNISALAAWGDYTAAEASAWVEFLADESVAWLGYLADLADVRGSTSSTIAAAQTQGTIQYFSPFLALPLGQVPGAPADAGAENVIRTLPGLGNMRRCMSCHGTGVIFGRPTETLPIDDQLAIMRWTRTVGPREADAVIALQVHHAETLRSRLPLLGLIQEAPRLELLPRPDGDINNPLMPLYYNGTYIGELNIETHRVFNGFFSVELVRVAEWIFDAESDRYENRTLPSDWGEWIRVHQAWFEISSAFPPAIEKPKQINRAPGVRWVSLGRMFRIGIGRARPLQVLMNGHWRNIANLTAAQRASLQSELVGNLVTAVRSFANIWTRLAPRQLQVWLTSLQRAAYNNPTNPASGRLSEVDTRALLAFLRERGWTTPRGPESSWVGGWHINIINPGGGANIHLPVPVNFVP